jgi:hypothetical protein
VSHGVSRDTFFLKSPQFVGFFHFLCDTRPFLGDAKMADQEKRESPVVWLTVYQAATREGHFALAERARRELYRLGIIIQGMPPLTEEPGK